MGLPIGLLKALAGPILNKISKKAAAKVAAKAAARVTTSPLIPAEIVAEIGFLGVVLGEWTLQEYHNNIIEVIGQLKGLFL